MPAKSAAQQKAAGAALTAKHEDRPVDSLTWPSRSVTETMTIAEFEVLAFTKHKNLPQHIQS